MSTQRDDDDFDRWVTEKGGPEAVVAMIDDMKRRVADGSLPGFRDKEALLAYWQMIDISGRDLVSRDRRRRVGRSR